MVKLPLLVKGGHIFVELSGGLWLIDTGAPSSFGTTGSLTIASEQFDVGADYLGLTVASLSQFVGVQCVGLLGADILSRFDHIFDTANGSLFVSTAEISHSGQMVHLDDFMGIPIVPVRVGDADYRMFFDTGAQISYFQDCSLRDYPSVGTVMDFYPGFGQFQTESHEVPISIGGIPFTIRCGSLPGLLGATLMMADTQGIIGNSILSDRIIGYFPRRRMMVL